jgi:hypothetical protein
MSAQVYPCRRRPQGWTRTSKTCGCDRTPTTGLLHGVSGVEIDLLRAGESEAFRRPPDHAYLAVVFPAGHRPKGVGMAELSGCPAAGNQHNSPLRKPDKPVLLDLQEALNHAYDRIELLTT